MTQHLQELIKFGIITCRGINSGVNWPRVLGFDMRKLHINPFIKRGGNSDLMVTRMAMWGKRASAQSTSFTDSWLPSIGCQGVSKLSIRMTCGSSVVLRVARMSSSRWPVCLVTPRYLERWEGRCWVSLHWYKAPRIGTPFQIYLTLMDVSWLSVQSMSSPCHLEPIYTLWSELYHHLWDGQQSRWLLHHIRQWWQEEQASGPMKIWEYMCSHHTLVTLKRGRSA